MISASPGGGHSEATDFLIGEVTSSGLQWYFILLIVVLGMFALGLVLYGALVTPRHLTICLSGRASERNDGHVNSIDNQFEPMQMVPLVE